VERAVVHARRKSECIALLFLDLDDFKRVNDSLGHQAGDVLLREVADRLKSVVRAEDIITAVNDMPGCNTVARIGGDEFIILLSDLTHKLDAATVAARILDKLESPVLVEQHELYVKTSIGITTFPEDGDSAESLIKNADIAMYHAKEHGKNHYQFFATTMNTALIQRLTMEDALRKALDRGQLLLHYQPQVATKNGEITGVEALIRWLDPEKGLISPGEFIPLAEDTGLIVPIGDWVLYEACRQNKAWQVAGYSPISISVNISSRQFSTSDMRATLEKVLLETKLDAKYLDIELTETLIMKDPEKIAGVLNELKSLGVRISMDDFGTGYSSLSMLKKLPIDCLKIDQSFVRDLATDSDDAAITATIIAMSRSLNLEVIAEGVEQTQQLAYLRELDCEKMQGYLASRPLPAAEMTALLANGRPLLGDLAFAHVDKVKTSKPRS
jgi:diguanylate cyclase (GGDEF)-like protein